MALLWKFWCSTVWLQPCLCSQGLEEVGRSDLGKKIKEGVEEAAKTAKHSAESVSKSGEKLGKTGAFRAISQVTARADLERLIPALANPNVALNHRAAAFYYP